MKKYIKPTTETYKAELTAILAGSDPQTNENLGGSQLSKEFDFVTEGEQAWKNEYPAFSLWED